MLARQRRAMTDALAELWAKRASGLPLRTPQEAVILASIVEKETGVPDERPRIAAVFLNRLARHAAAERPDDHLRPDAGPGGARSPVSRAELETRHAWNTYVIAGLPPTPIANPGRAAIAAVLNPLPARSSTSSPTGRAATSSRRRWPITIATSRGSARSNATVPIRVDDRVIDDAVRHYRR